MKLDQLKKAAAGPVVLKVDRLNAERVLCPAGTQISPKVEGWPVNRVMQALQNGYAKVGSASAPAASGSSQAAQSGSSQA